MTVLRQFSANNDAWTPTVRFTERTPVWERTKKGSTMIDKALPAGLAGEKLSRAITGAVIG